MHDLGLCGPILTHPLPSLLCLADVFQTQIIRVPGEPAAPVLRREALLRAPALESAARPQCSRSTQQLESLFIKDSAAPTYKCAENRRGTPEVYIFLPEALVPILIYTQALCIT